MKEYKTLHLDRPVIVEGRYDKEKLLSFVSGTVITTGGFAIFNSRETLALIRRLAAPSGILFLTDSDGAGTVIRGYITSALPKDAVTQLYIPKIKGKEKRKKAPSRAGTLGVEGIDVDTLYKILLPFSVEGGKDTVRGEPIKKRDLYLDGLSGSDGAGARRDALAERLGLPPGMTPNAFLSALNVLLTLEEYRKIISEMEN